MKDKIQPRRLIRSEVVLNTKQINDKSNKQKFEELLQELGTNKKTLVRKSFKIVYHNHLTYSRVFKRWRKDNFQRKLVSWFKRQPLYPSEVNRIVNMMSVLYKKYDLGIEDDLLTKAIFLTFYLEDDLSEMYKKMVLSKGYREPKCFKGKSIKALRELKARGFIHIEDYSSFDPDYNYVVFNQGEREYYYPVKCASMPEHHSEGCPDVHILQSLVGVPGYTAVEYSINRKNKTNGRKPKR